MLLAPEAPFKGNGPAGAPKPAFKVVSTNTLFLADNQGQPLACATPQAGNHYDLFDIKALFDELCDLVQEAQIRLDGLFLNANSGFDARALREACFRRDIKANIAHNPRSAPSDAAADH